MKTYVIIIIVVSVILSITGTLLGLYFGGVFNSRTTTPGTTILGTEAYKKRKETFSTLSSTLSLSSQYCGGLSVCLNI